MVSRKKHLRAAICFLGFPLLLVGFRLGTNQVAPSALRPVNLRCEYLRNPLGIDVPDPRLTWALTVDKPIRGEKQTAYRILVASSEAHLKADKADLWDSGKVQSDQTLHVAYTGKPLRSRIRCWWKVQVWDSQGRPSSWSESAMWSMGLLDAQDWSGHWIGPQTYPEDPRAFYLRRSLTVSRRPAHATARISGLGSYELYVNGKKAGNHVLDPGFTDYDRRVLYVTYDVTNSFRPGRNAIGVILGNGWYHSPTPDFFGFEKAPWRSLPKLLVNVDLEFGDGSRETIASDASWRWSTGPITFNSLRGGETYDARRENPNWADPDYDGENWRPVAIMPSPKGQLNAQMMPPIRVTETRKPLKLTEPKPRVYVFDFGVNLTGWVRFQAAGRSGQKVTLEFGEALRTDGTVDMEYSRSHTNGRFQTGELVLNSQGQGVFEPRFTYHGFRYVQVSGLEAEPALDSMVGKNVHTDWESAGEFSCSNPKINQLQQAVRRTLNLSTHSLPGEEPTREKMGWTQDGQNVMEAAVYNFDAAAVYTKYLQDIIDAQEANGHVPSIVPTNGWGRTNPDGSPAEYSDPWFGATLCFVAEKLYEYYGDRRVLEVAFEPTKRWVDYLQETAKDQIIEWGIGDWQEAGHPARPKRTPIVQTTTAGYFGSVLAVSRIAMLLGKQDEAAKYQQLAEEIRTRFNRRFFTPQTGLYAEDSQTAQALPLWLGIVPEGNRGLVLQRLTENIRRRKNHLSTGFIGVMPLLHGLVEWGHEDLAFKLATQEDTPGFLQMTSDGNSTLGESLDRLYGTRNHPFGACIGSWLFRHLAGIRTDPSAPAFENIMIRPVTGDLTWVEAKYRSLRGPIATAWRREPHELSLTVSIPPNTVGFVYLPTANPEAILEGGNPLSQASEVHFLRVQGGRSIVRIGSGSYAFTVKQ